MAVTKARAAGRRQMVLLALGFAALVVAGASSAWLVKRTEEFNLQAARTLEAGRAAMNALATAKDAETGQRGFLLTGDQRYLLPYDRAFGEVEKVLTRLGELVAPDGDQRADYEALKAAVNLKLAELKETVELQKAGRAAEARAVVETDRGRLAMREVRRLAILMDERENAAFVERSNEARRAANLLLAVVLIGLLIASGLAYMAQRIVRRQTDDLAAAQVKLEDANHGLEDAVRERTADLMQANEEIQRFAYIVSHDLRAPLVNVMGFTSELDAARKVLKEQIDGLDEVGAAKVRPDARAAIEEDLPEAIGFIRTSTTKMDRLINAILKLSREGRRDVRPESVAVDALVATIADTMYQQTQAADAEIEVQAGLPAIVTDRLSIEQIFQNLIENAVKYLDRSRPGRVRVTGRRIGPQIEYAIEDNGRGIDPKDHERVFELFRRAGQQDQPGEGLGLAFVRANVRRLGGAIRLTSEPGRGSTFHLTFPAVYRPPSESRA